MALQVFTGIIERAGTLTSAGLSIQARRSSPVRWKCVIGKTTSPCGERT